MVLLRLIPTLEPVSILKPENFQKLKPGPARPVEARPDAQHCLTHLKSIPKIEKKKKEKTQRRWHPLWFLAFDSTKKERKNGVHRTCF